MFVRPSVLTNHAAKVAREFPAPDQSGSADAQRPPRPIGQGGAYMLQNKYCS